VPGDGFGHGHRNGVGLWKICCSGGGSFSVGRVVDEVLIGLASFLRSRKGVFPSADQEKEFFDLFLLEEAHWYMVHMISLGVRKVMIGRVEVGTMSRQLN